MVVDKINNIAAGLSIVLLVAFIFGVFLAWPVQLLWNLALAPATTFLKPIGFFQAWGILILFSILFKSHITTNKK